MESYELSHRTNQEVYQKNTPSSFHPSILLLALILGFVLLCIVLFALLRQKSKQNPSTGNIYVNQNNIATINICIQQHDGYPLIANILTTQADPNLGVFEGTIHTVSNQTITVSSNLSNHIFTFTVTKRTQVYDIHHRPVNNPASIASGVKAFISFPCFQKNNSFDITQIQLVK